MPNNQTKSSIISVLESKRIERIEIELLPNSQFRWKLWADGQLAFCAAGRATTNEIDAMMESTSLIAKKTLGVPTNA